MPTIKKIIWSILPETIRNHYHKVQAFLAAARYGFPSTKIHIIGITGTKGKTSSANLMWSVLSHGGFKTGLIGTANIRIGDVEKTNTMHMTMFGPWVTQKLLREMLDAGCTHVVMEVTSEGIKQYRHIGIKFQTAVFTNLSPEHLASHDNNFEKYKQTKGILFQTLKDVSNSLSIINIDTPHGAYYASFPAGKIITYGLTNGEVQATNIRESNTNLLFDVDNELYNLNLLGVFNIANALPAIILGRELGILQSHIRQGLAALTLIPGRMEKIDEGQPYTVIVDYAHEKLSINALLDTAQTWQKPGSRIITVIGAEGGGRDPAKREHMGRAAGTKSDYVIVTTTDPYDDDPKMLAEAVAGFVEITGKTQGETLFVVVDRTEGLRKALSIAREDDIVLFTGMGAQETMMVRGVALPWDERAIVRKLIQESLTDNL